MKGTLLNSRFFARAAVAVCSLALVAPAGSAQAATTDRDRAFSAATWQAGELPQDGVMVTSYQFYGETYSYRDFGLTIDTALALASEGRHLKALDRAAAAIEDHYYSEYATSTSFGTDESVTYAGSVAKVLTATRVLRQNPRDYGGHDVVALLMSLRAKAGAGFEEGRFRNSDYASGGDYSNTLGQAFAVIGLSRSGGAPQSSVDYLLKQQCKAGYFRVEMLEGQTCNQSGSAADVDATALAIQALVAAARQGTEFPSGKLDKAADWLVGVQRPSGGFGGGSITPGANTNSTGLAAQALTAVGRVKARAAATKYVAFMQLTKARVGDGPARGDVGAIAYNQEARNVAVRNGITDLTADQFRRATAQGLFAFTKTSLVTLRRP